MCGVAVSVRCVCSAREYVPPSFDERVSALPQLYTATEVRSHSEVDACKYFPVSEEQHAALPSPLSSALSEEFSTAGQFLQLHPAYLPFIARLSALHSPRGRFYLRKPWLVDGAHGSGRTTLLYYLHLWANESGWLVVSAQADEFSREKMGWHTDNPERSGIRDQPLYTQHFMAQLAKRQGDKLSMVQLKRSRPSAPDCTTLLDLVQLAASDAQLAVRTQHAHPAPARLPASPLCADVSLLPSHRPVVSTPLLLL